MQLLQERCRVQQRNCRPARCQGRFRLLPQSSWWLTGKGRLSERQATRAETHTRDSRWTRPHYITDQTCNTSLQTQEKDPGLPCVSGKQWWHFQTAFPQRWSFQWWLREGGFSSVRSWHWNKKKVNTVGVMASSCWKLTFPVHSKICVPEVVADFMSRYSFDSVSSFERIQNDPVLLHFSPVNLVHREQNE